MNHGRFFLGSLAVVLSIGSLPGLAQELDHGSFYCISDHPGSTLSQALHVVNYLYARGPSPQPVAFAGNADCQGGVNLIDVIYLVNHAFRGGPPPCDFCGWYVDPSDTRDAETIAMWLAREVTAPETLLNRIQGDLVRLRTLPGAEQTALASLQFFPRWIESRIDMSVDSVTNVAMQEGLYRAWDELNLAYEADQITFDHPYPSAPFFVTIHFAGIKNSGVLAESYAQLPGVNGTWVQHRVWIGSAAPSVIYPLMRSDTVTYLFQMSWDFRGIWGRQRFWYTAALADTAWIVGDWDPGVNPETPLWWPRALENIDHYWED